MAEIEVQNEKDLPAQAEEIHLFTEKEGDAVEAAISIRWCICRSILEAIKRESALNPHILLVVTHNGKEVDRKIVPLEQEMEYFYFQRSGPHRIQATILCWKNAAVLRDFFLRKGDGLYRTDVVDWKGVLFDKIDQSRNPAFQIGRGEINVNVAPEFFAKKPPAWLWKWGNLWYETKPRDQCQFRRRCMLAFSIQPIVVPVWVVFICLFRLSAALFLRFGCGVRKIDFEPVYRPFALSTNNVWWVSQCQGAGSVFFSDKDGKSRHWLLGLFMPTTIVPLFGSLYALIYFLKPGLGIVWVSGIAIGVLAGTTLLVYLSGCLLLSALNMIQKFRFPLSEAEDKQGEQREEREKRLRREKKAAFDRKCDETYSSLVCQGAPLKASLNALPKRRRTVYLRLMNIKTKICRPFAK